MNPTTYVQSIYQGIANINRLSQAEEQGRLAGGPRLLQATYTASGGCCTNDKDQNANSRSKDEQIAWLLDFAKKEGILYDISDLEVIGDYLDNGGEQYVYFHGGTPYVTKFNSFKFHETPLQYFDRIALHNYLFPEAPYTLIGFSIKYPEDPTCFSAVLTQPYVIADRGAERDEVKKEMMKMGFEHAGGDTYLSPDYIVEDLHQGNALITPMGNIAIVDPVIYLNTKEDEYEGERTINNYG